MLFLGCNKFVCTLQPVLNKIFILKMLPRETLLRGCHKLDYSLQRILNKTFDPTDTYQSITEFVVLDFLFIQSHQFLTQWYPILPGL